jgi:hypothetical protein
MWSPILSIVVVLWSDVLILSPLEEVCPQPDSSRQAPKKNRLAAAAAIAKRFMENLLAMKERVET